MKTIYWMVAESSHEIAYWEPCQAKTLVGAKREATRLYAGHFRDAVLMIASGDNVTVERQVLCRRAVSEDRWTDAL